jgi:hypothetical protein
MSDTFNYSLVKNDQGTYAIRSSVKSFNLDHVVDKDLVSFYQTFSQHASIDTGLLPLDGTGVLAIRSAGPHTQIVTQHKPGNYYVNWGSHEGDRNAKTYYVAQPYRIVIGDFKDGNLLGARMFYSPYPITSPNALLYHVNLPNINCKGYRGNGVGWICLYHKDDWSHLPFNEKVALFVERCSGVETYNDANMSETDGPRFYQQNGKPSYLWNPESWEQKSQEGYTWTLDPGLWIPVIVKDMDNQDKHYESGQHLTLAMAMLGNYQGYYTDQDIPKMYNKVSRSDYNLENSDIAQFFKSSFASAPVSYTYQEKFDPYSFTVSHREKNGSETLSQQLFEDPSEEFDWHCAYCEEGFTGEAQNTICSGDPVCEDCCMEYCTYIESTGEYWPKDHNEIVWATNLDSYLHDEHDLVASCIYCDEYFGASGKSDSSFKTFNRVLRPLQNEGEFVCTDCIQNFCEDQDEELTVADCYTCTNKVIQGIGYEHMYPTYKILFPSINEEYPVVQHVTICNACNPKYSVCPCGLLKEFSEINTKCSITNFNQVIDTELEVAVTKCCSTCLGDLIVPDDPNMPATALYKPFNQTNFEAVVEHKIYLNSTSVVLTGKQDNEIF